MILLACILGALALATVWGSILHMFKPDNELTKGD